MKRILLSLLLLFLVNHLFAQKTVYIPRFITNTGMDLNNTSSQWCYARSFQTDNTIVFWEAGFGSDPSTAGGSYRVNLNNLIAVSEKSYFTYLDTLKFAKRGSSVTDRYKMMIFLLYTTEWAAYGSGQDDLVGTLHVNPAAANINTVLAHEIGHCFEYITGCDTQGGYRYGFGANGSGGNGFWEQCANWMSFKTYPAQQFTAGDFNNYVRNNHKHIIHETPRYANYFVQDYWTFKRGKDFMGRLWRESLRPEDPIETYKRLNSITQEQFNDEMYEHASRLTTWDIPAIRSYGASRIDARPQIVMNQTSDNYWMVDPSVCIENYGYNSIKLNAPTQAAQVTVRFRGRAGEAGFRALNVTKGGWRYGFVALLNDGTRVYSSVGVAKVVNGVNPEQTLTFNCPANCSKLWLVVSGSPQEHWKHAWDDNDANDEHWPYQVQFSNTNLLGKPNNTNVAPTVSISSPANNASFTTPASININATAADSDGSVSSVAFYNGTTLLGTDATSPYSFSWTNVAAGTYSLTARATDNGGAVTTSTAVSVTVTSTTNVSPTVSISSPSNNATFTAPASITINATAADADGSVSSVAFYNGTTLLGTDATSPYSFSWTNVAAGTYSLTARATDNAGAVTTSSAVSIVVSGACTPTAITPYVQLNGGTWSQVSSASLNAGGTVKFGPQPVTGGSWSWTGPNSYAATTREITLTNIQSTQAGNYIASHTNAAGCVSTQTFAVTVLTANVAPTVSITAPANSASFTAPASITISATAADSDGTVTSVAFYNGTTLLGTDATSPYSFSWTNVVAGTYSLTAKATDNSGAVTTSTAVSVVVNNVVSNADIIGVDCSNSNTTISFELNSSLRANATSYNWWYTGSSQSISVSPTTPYISTMQTGVNFSAGQVCIGVNYSVSPWYTSYCKSLAKCASARIGDNTELEINTSVAYPNPSTYEFNFVTKSEVSKIDIINEIGETVYSKEKIVEGEDILFGTNFSAGIYLINILYQDGRHETQKIIKIK